MYDGKRHAMTFKRALKIVIFIPLFMTLIDYGYIKADMIGTFDLVTSLTKSFYLLIIIFVMQFLEGVFIKKFAKS